MCAMQCTTLIETCSQCTNSSIFNLNLPSKLAGMQVLQNGRRFGSTWNLQNFPKIFISFQKFFHYFLYISHTQNNMLWLKYLVIGEKVCFRPIVKCDICAITCQKSIQKQLLVVLLDTYLYQDSYFNDFYRSPTIRMSSE